MWGILFAGIAVVIAAVMYNNTEDELPAMLQLPKDSLARTRTAQALPARWDVLEAADAVVVTLSSNERIPGPGHPAKLVWQCAYGRLSLAFDPVLPLVSGKSSPDNPAYAPVSVGLGMTGTAPLLTTWWFPVDGAGHRVRVMYSDAQQLTRDAAERMVSLLVRYRDPALGEQVFTFDARGLGGLRGKFKACPS